MVPNRTPESVIREREIMTESEKETFVEAMELLRSLKHQRDLLAKEAVEMGVLLGIVDGTVPLTGPEVLLLCGDIKHVIKHYQERIIFYKRERYKEETYPND